MVVATSDEHPQGDSRSAGPAAGAEAHEARALALERAGRLEDAAEAFDSALLREPGRRTSAEGRARVALELLATDAVDHCRRALGFHERNPDLQLRMAVIRPEPGRLALFPGYLFHGTRPFPAGERLTVAFDVVAA